MKLNISLFKFDYKSDYLPYYTKHFLNMKEEETLLDILNIINKEYPFSYDSSEDFYVVINDIYINVNTKCEDIKQHFGIDLQIEPLSIRLANTDLTINENSFNEKFLLLEEFINKEDKEDFFKIYNSYKVYFYASATQNLEYNYIGDAIFLLANTLISIYPDKEKKILKALKDCDYGIQYHTSLSNKIFNFDENIEKEILILKKKLILDKLPNKSNFQNTNTKDIDFGNFTENLIIKYDFKDFTLAYFEGIKPCSQTLNLLDKLNAKLLNLHSLKQDLAKDTFNINPDFTYKLAGNVMIESFDNGADFLIVDNEEDFYLFDTNRKKIEKFIGRELNIPILHKNELQKLASGEHKNVSLSLNKHFINPDII